MINKNEMSVMNNSLRDLIKTYLTNKVSSILDQSPDSLSLDDNLLEIGLDSVTLVEIAEDFEEELGMDCLLYTSPSPRD